MDIKSFSNRVATLRAEKNVSAREMSLSIGQSSGYISGIENGVSYPSMQIFFYICDFFEITPSEFFDNETQYPDHLKSLIEELKHLDAKQLDLIYTLVRAIQGKN